MEGFFWFWLRNLPFPAAPVGFRRSGSRKCAFSGRNRRRFSPRRAGPANSGHTSPLSLQVRLGNHQVREARKQRKPLHVLVQTPIANHVAAEHPLDDPERMLHPGPHPGLRLLRPGKAPDALRLASWSSIIGSLRLQNSWTQCTRSITDSGCGCRPLPPPFGHAGAMRASRRSQGIRPSIRSRKISRRVLRFLRSHSRLAKVNCRRHCTS